MATSETVPADAVVATNGWAQMIVKTPGTCSGRVRIAGTRIRVRHVFGWIEESGMTPAQVIEQHPQLTMAQIHAALAYYWSHPDEIQQEIADEDRLVEELMKQAGPSKLRERLAELHAADDSLPSG